MDDSGSESQYYAVYVVPHWDRFEVDDEEDDDDEEDVDDWGHRGYFLVGPFGVYEARADAHRFAKDVASHVAAVLNGSDGLDSSWALSRALPTDCVAHVRSFGSEADFVLRNLDRAFHAKLRGVMTRMLEAKRAEYLEKLLKHAKSYPSGSRTAAGRRAQGFFRMELRKNMALK